MNKIITQFQQVLGIVPVGKYGAETYMNFNYEGQAISTDNVALTINGFIAFLYFSAYQTQMPNIFADPPALTTDIEKSQIYSVYDSLQITRPNL
jgi:hypothetical protein